MKHNLEKPHGILFYICVGLTGFVIGGCTIRKLSGSDVHKVAGKSM